MEESTCMCPIEAWEAARRGKEFQTGFTTMPLIYTISTVFKAHITKNREEIN